MFGINGFMFNMSDPVKLPNDDKHKQWFPCVMCADNQTFEILTE